MPTFTIHNPNRTTLGTPLADTILGSTGDDTVYGGSGNDSLYGNDGADHLFGDGGDDVLMGENGNDTLQGGAGADKLDGGAGLDTADYSTSSTGVTITLVAGTGSGGDAQGDSLVSIENLFGSTNNDVFISASGANVLNGNSGVDRVDYSFSPIAVTVNLSAGTASDGDMLVSIENVTGSKFDDMFTGSSDANSFDGGAGIDAVDYSKSKSGIVLSFSATDSFGIGGQYRNSAAGGYAGDAAGDKFASIETLIATDYRDWVGGGDVAMTYYLGGGDDIFDNNYSYVVNDIVYGGAGQDVIWLGRGDDLAFGGADFDQLMGEIGNDRLNGGPGGDVLNGGEGIDAADYSTSSAAVTVNLAAGTATGGDATGDRLLDIEDLIGSDFNDVLVGNSGANRLMGGLGDDILSGREGADRLEGGDGRDTADYSSSASGVTVNLAAGTASDGDTLVSIENVTGSAFDDIFIGSSIANRFDGGAGVDMVDYSASTLSLDIDLAAGLSHSGLAEGDRLIDIERLIAGLASDVVAGSDADNWIEGRGGDDILRGFGGDDHLFGGDGNDRIYGGVGADIIDGGAGVDTADYHDSSAGVIVSLLTGLGQGGEAAGDQLSSIENLSGSAFDDILVGDAGTNRLVGGMGSDKLYGGAGNDMFDTGGGYDFVDGGVGVDTVTYDDSWGLVVVNLTTGTGSGAEAAGDTYTGIENVIGSAFDDRLTGDGNVNRLNGMDGNDTLDGGAGNDVLVGGLGADVLIGGAGDQDAASYQDASLGVTVNLALGGTGGEAAGDTYSGIEYVYGSDFNDSITGDAAVNRLTGGAGNDFLDGAAGNDYLLGDAGNDMLTGGSGADVFVFNAGFGDDSIIDFWAGAGRTDRAWFQGAGLNSFADLLSHAADTAAGVVVTIAGQGSLTLTGLSIAQLNADDFLFG